jgi:hypothetical protein
LAKFSIATGSENYPEWIPFAGYGGCQKNVPLFKRFYLLPLLPPFRISEFIVEKSYNCTTAVLVYQENKMPATDFQNQCRQSFRLCRLSLSMQSSQDRNAAGI